MEVLKYRMLAGDTAYFMFCLLVSFCFAGNQERRLYEEYYETNNGQIEVYYDEIDEHGQLSGGKVSLPLELPQELSLSTETGDGLAYENDFRSRRRQIIGSIL